MSKRKALFVSSAFPADLGRCVHGLYQRMGMFIEALRDVADLDILFYVNSSVPTSKDYLDNMQWKLGERYGAKIRLHLFHLSSSKPMGSRLQNYGKPIWRIQDWASYSRYTGIAPIRKFQSIVLSRNFDIVFAHRLSSMSVVVLSRSKLPLTFFDLDDIEHIALWRSIRQPPWWNGKVLSYLHVPRLLLWERRAIKISTRTFVCSEHDKRYLRKWGLRNVVPIPNAVVLHPRGFLTSEPTLLFVGHFGYEPNVVGCEFLITQIFPKILSSVRNARLMIIGQKPENVPSFRHRPHGVEFLGFVDDLEEIYGKVRVVCCPIISGGGTRIKILEAAAYGKPVVSTILGAEGLDLVSGKEIFICRDEEAFAERCLSLLTDEGLALNIGEAARAAVSRMHDKSIVLTKIKEEFLCGLENQGAGEVIYRRTMG